MFKKTLRPSLFYLWFSICVCVTTRGEEQPNLVNTTDFILCRHCGFNIAAGSLLTNFVSPAALSATNQTLFGVHSLLVQTVRNSLGIEFDVVTAKGGTCVPSHSYVWQTDESWYPGHAWKTCSCSKCSRHIGWVFEPLASASESRVYASSHGFYAFVLDNIISEAWKMASDELTDEQLEFLAQCEADFAHRYTEKDQDFIIVKQIGTSRPPIVEPWKPRGQNQNRDRERFRDGRNRGHRRSYRDGEDDEDNRPPGRQRRY